MNFNVFSLKKLKTLLLLSCIAQTPVYAATALFDKGFETGNLSGLKCSGNCPTVIKSPTANGNYAAKFALTRSMSTPYRTEAVLKQKIGFEFGQEYWVGLSYRFEDWAKDSSADSAPFQMHTTPSSWTHECDLGSAASTAPFLMATKDGKSKFIYYGNRVLWEEPLETKKWKNVVIHFKITSNRQGFVEAWVDGVKRGRYDGLLSPKTDKCGKPMLPPYFKIGVYKWDWKAGRPQTDSNRRELLLDNFKIATGSNGFDMVKASGQAGNTSTDATSQPADSGSSSTTTTTTSTTPGISNIQVNTTENTATVTWVTNKNMNSIVKYGLDSSYGAGAKNNALVTNHRITLDNLATGTTYHYKLVSRESNGTTIRSQDLTFTTTEESSGDMLAHWLMDIADGSTVADLSGNNHVGKLVNGAYMTNYSGIRLDGVNDYMNVGALNIPGNEVTVTGWFRSEDLANCPYFDCRILSKATGTAEQDHYLMLSTAKIGTKVRVRFRLKTQGITETLEANSGDIVDNIWYHVAAVYNGSTMRLYLNGNEVGSMAKTGNINANDNAALWIGGNPPDAFARPWKGKIEDVRIYGYALTKGEVANLVNE